MEKNFLAAALCIEEKETSQQREVENGKREQKGKNNCDIEFKTCKH